MPLSLPHQISVGGATYDVRRATRADVPARGCALVQLTTDKRRDDAHRFYSRLGFEATHEGFKLRL